MSVPPNIMSAGPAMGAPPMSAAPMGMPMGAPPAQTPAGAALPGMAQLAQAQQAQMMQIQDEMNKQIMMLIASLPTPNPAGNAAVTTPTTPMMSSPTDQQSMSGAATPGAMGGSPSGY